MRDRTKQARRGAFTGPARAGAGKITAYTICETPGCGHMRSAHPRGGACRHGIGQGPFRCKCEGFTVTLPEKPPRPARRKFTEDDIAMWRADFERGLSYREVSRRYRVGETILRNKLPGYNGNSTHPNGTNGVRSMT